MMEEQLISVEPFIARPMLFAASASGRWTGCRA